ncbi:MAG: GNAT family N-acetyltransferase [Verrucomicrobium sp.]|nr:GNAT family N-acetyltransferase [Verrucomicrobium sp.]
MNTLPWEIRFEASSTLLQKIGRLRVEAWQTAVSQAANMETWLDEADQGARHWVVFEGGEPVGAARLTIHERLADLPDGESYEGMFPQEPVGPIASLNRLVVHPSARGRGISKVLDLVRLQAAEEMGCQSAILATASGPGRVQQLQGWGFQLVGEGPRFQKPPLCHLPPPAILICPLPRAAAPGSN